MRIRPPFAGPFFPFPILSFQSPPPPTDSHAHPPPSQPGTFLLLLLLSAWLWLSSAAAAPSSSDKLVHFTTLFALTLVFYWVLDTSRRRAVHLTLTVCTVGLAVGSEFVQSFLPNDRDFDIFDIFANVAGSLVAVALCSWYHRRMLDRRRTLRRAGAGGAGGGNGGGGNGGGGMDADDEDDVELGLTQGHGRDGDGEDEGVEPRSRTLEERVDAWDENAVDEDDIESMPSKVDKSGNIDKRTA